jgi:hypothetical protein
MRTICHITRQTQGATPSLFYPAHRLVCIWSFDLFAEKGDSHVRTFACECYGDRTPDATIASGNKRDFALQAATPAIASLPMVSARVHVCVATGYVLLLIRWDHW